MIYPVRTPWILKKMYRQCIWEMPAEGNKVYLSFDDGPHPVATDFVLNLLRNYQMKASFFCIGNNVVRYPELYSRIVSEGHATGNHSFNHLNGWKTSTEEYIDDIKEAGKHIPAELFRPPYGRIKFGQVRRVQQMGMKTIMWSLLSGDFDLTVSKEKCADNILNNVKPGDIIVFHDSEKAFERLKYALPLVLETIIARGWVTEKL